MPYYAVSYRTIFGHKYEPGDEIPPSVTNRLKSRVLTRLLSGGRIRFEDEYVHPTKQVPFTYKGAGWWEAPNGMKIRGKKDKPPVMAGV